MLLKLCKNLLINSLSDETGQYGSNNKSGFTCSIVIVSILEDLYNSSKNDCSLSL